MSELWKTCRQAQVACKGCGKMDSCTVSPEGTSFKCWRNDGKIVHDQERRAPARGDWPASFMTLQLAAERLSTKLGTCTGTWQYKNAADRPHMAVLRFDGPEGKQYRPFHIAAGSWHIGDPAGKLPLYRLSEVMQAQRVYLCEGEKAAESGRKIELLCTCSAHGAGAALKSDWSVLAGKEVIILPDNDAPGTKYADTVAGELLDLEPPAKVKILYLPGLPPAGDLVDWLEIVKDHAPQHIHGYIEAYAEQLEWLLKDQLPPSSQSEEAEQDGPMMTNLSEVKPEPIQWLWEGKLALGKLAGWAGAPGDGKSIASMDVAARVTTGAPWPDKGNAIQGSVLLITAEDGLADTIRPRLDAAGADVARVHHFAMIRRTVNGKASQELFTLKKVRQLERSLEKVPDCRLIIIDPVGSFFGTDVDSNGDAGVRSILAPIAALAEAKNIAVLLIMHTRKESGERADDAVMGSRAFTGIVRSMWHIRRDDDDSERRLFLPGKNNSYKAISGLGYRVVDGNPGAKVEWEKEPVQMTADQAVRKSRGQSSSERDQVVDWLKEELLGCGPRPAGNPENDDGQPGTILQASRNVGLGWRRVQRAANDMGVKRSRTPSGMLWSFEKV